METGKKLDNEEQETYHGYDVESKVVRRRK